jgi:hypothetical protein
LIKSGDPLLCWGHRTHRLSDTGSHHC